jgi:cytoskeletal protein CcmA (bactofilin family)
MPDFPRRRLLDRLVSTPTLVAQHTQIRGDIDTEGALMVNGAVQGNGRIGGEIAIATGALWQGDLRAQSAVIAGAVIGDVLVADKIEIGAKARIRGRVTARLIAIARGALIDGEIICTGNEPVMEFEERRAVIPGE